jgi:hypothetical protein
MTHATAAVGPTSKQLPQHPWLEMHENSMMQKYYVQSDKSRWVLLAPDLDGAAIRFAHCVLRECVKDQELPEASSRLIDEEIYHCLLERFGDTVVVSESGFEGDQVGIFATPEVLDRWNKQIQALETKMRNRDV